MERWSLKALFCLNWGVITPSSSNWGKKSQPYVKMDADIWLRHSMWGHSFFFSFFASAVCQRLRYWWGRFCHDLIWVDKLLLMVVSWPSWYLYSYTKNISVHRVITWKKKWVGTWKYFASSCTLIIFMHHHCLLPASLWQNRNYGFTCLVVI